VQNPYLNRYTKSYMKINSKRALSIGGAAAGAVVVLIMAVPAFAATTSSTSSSTPTHHTVKGTHKFNGIIGTVSSIDGTTLTVTSTKGTAYSVDASAATFVKGFGKSATTIALSNIAVSDHVAVMGAVTGDSVAATKIDDGVMAHTKKSGTSTTSTGTHQRLANAAFGTVASVNGNTITLTRKTKTGTSTVTAVTTGTTTYKKNGVADTASDITVGQRVVVMGTKDTSGNITAATSVNIMVRKSS
jgi:hypothetical protein